MGGEILTRTHPLWRQLVMFGGHPPEDLLTVAALDDIPDPILQEGTDPSSNLWDVEHLLGEPYPLDLWDPGEAA